MMKKIYFSMAIAVSMLLFYCDHAQGQETQKTMNQIRLLLQEKETRTPVQRKISSQLLQAEREKRGKKMAEGLTLVPANVDADARGYINVDIRAAVSDSLLLAIRNMGGKIIFASVKYG